MWPRNHQIKKKASPELNIEQIDLQLLNKLQILYYQEMQKK